MTATPTAPTIHPVLQGSPFQSYVYAYPHKTAYRPLSPSRSLATVWSQEPTDRLFLYLHIPFCTMRCGFCNLFTTPRPNDSLVALYLDSLRRHADVVRSRIPNAKFSQFAIGGGTPTYLNEPALEAVFDLAEHSMGVDLQDVPVAIETSPDTINSDKASLMRVRGVTRVSIGVQSFVESETANVGRPQSATEVDAALTLLQLGRFPTFNIDLIYGLPGQTVDTWLSSIRRALIYGPNELFLYPLYVRPLTGLGRSQKRWDDLRLACYREGRELLLSEGFTQISMRMFRRQRSSLVTTPVYCCQEDGMIGLGCGARSYTRDLHYSLDYAVGAKNVKEIIADYLSRGGDEFSAVDYGFELDLSEQRRRYLLQSILNIAGLRVSEYRRRFGTEPEYDFPDLLLFSEFGLLTMSEGVWRPTIRGLERADAIGPWFYSSTVRSLMSEYVPR